jgi:hypothetical protein
MELNSHFDEEFQRQSRLLLPDRPVLLALVRLYSWLLTTGAEVFDEPQLREALTAAERDMPEVEFGTVYTPWQRHTGIVRDLQAYWLLRSATPGPATYRLKPHARGMCKRLHTTLFSKLIVSEVEAAFRALKANLGENDEAFLNWARQLLPTLSLDVEQQLVALDNDIDTTLKQLRDQTSHTEEAFLATLHDVDNTLTDLLGKAEELNRAFNHAAQLEQQLTHIWTGNQQEREAVNREAQTALQFIRRARQRLDEVSQRLDWVRHNVRGLFSNLSKLRFDRKTEQFLLALLAAEPDAQPRLSHRLGYKPLRFERVPHAGQVLPSEPVQAPVRPENQPAQQAFQARTEEMMRVRGRVQHWLHELRQELAPAGASVRFGEFGQRLASIEGVNAHEVLTQLLATVRREDELQRQWQLRVTASEEEIIENDFVRIKLWKLTLTNP